MISQLLRPHQSPERKRRESAWTLLVLVSSLLAVAGSTRAAEPPTFVDDALPVLRQRCGTCHNADKREAGLDITSYAGIMQGGGSGEVIVPGDPAKSLLFRLANHDDEPKMPPDSPPIPESERRRLRAWIEAGVRERTGSAAVVPKKIEVAMTAPAAERPAVQPLPGHLRLEPVVHTPSRDGCPSIAASPWAPLVAVCGQRQVLLHRSDTRELAGVLPFPEGRPHVVRFSAGGGVVIAGGGLGATSGLVVAWDIATGRRLRTVGDELDLVLAADISPDQRLVALGGPQKVARIWSLESGTKLHDLGRHTDWILAVAFSPDGKMLATADRAGNVFLWDPTDGSDVLTIQAHPSAVSCLAWRGDSAVLVTGCEDGQLRLWNAEDGVLVKAWPAHGGGVTAVDFTRDGRIVSVGRDKSPKLWKADGSAERTFETAADIGIAVAWCDETERLVAGDWTGEIRVFDGKDPKPVGTLDPNPPAIAERVAAAERSLSECTQLLAEAVAARSAAAEGDRPQLDAKIATLEERVATAAGAHGRWLAEAAFQTNLEKNAAAP